MATNTSKYETDSPTTTNTDPFEAHDEKAKRSPVFATAESTDDPITVIPDVIPFDDERQSVPQSKKIKGAAQMAAGGALTVAGIPLLVLPGPGAVTIVGGVALTSKGHRNFTGRAASPLESKLDAAAAKLANVAKEQAKQAAKTAVKEAPGVAAKIAKQAPVVASKVAKRAPSVATKVADGATTIANTTIKAAPIVADKVVETAPKVAEKVAKGAPEVAGKVIVAAPAVAESIAKGIGKGIDFGTTILKQTSEKVANTTNKQQ